LNFIARARWVRPYLRYYLRLVDDDRCSIPENSPLPHHFTTREEELFKIDTVSFERLVTLLCQGVEGGLEDVALIVVRAIVVNTFKNSELFNKSSRHFIN
jgi:hypothetical protein